MANARERTKEMPAQKVVGHDFAPRKSQAERASERARGNVVLHDIPSYYTEFFGFDGAKKSREKSRSTRHLKTRPTTFFGRTADHANNCVLHDI